MNKFHQCKSSGVGKTRKKFTAAGNSYNLQVCKVLNQFIICIMISTLNKFVHFIFTTVRLQVQQVPIKFEKW